MASSSVVRFFRILFFFIHLRNAIISSTNSPSVVRMNTCTFFIFVHRHVYLYMHIHVNNFVQTLGIHIHQVPSRKPTAKPTVKPTCSPSAFKPTCAPTRRPSAVRMNSDNCIHTVCTNNVHFFYIRT